MNPFEVMTQTKFLMEKNGATKEEINAYFDHLEKTKFKDVYEYSVKMCNKWNKKH
ncbi:MAG: hypothetical protein IIZ78_06020 [Clostridiales bacterium]|nr:hypothetical protein [Clostridiales bacterium]